MIKINRAMVKFKNVLLIILLAITSMVPAQAQTAESHIIMNNKLKKSSFKKMVKACEKADVILFGEEHNDPISHWLELKLLKVLSEKGSVILGLEMFERDNQDILNQYLQGDIDLEKLEQEARLWNNYHTDYAPMIEFAKSSGIQVAATNIPRRYASIVYKEGFEPIESLVDEEKKYIAPLPIPYDAELPAYKKMLDMVDGHGGENFPKSQAIKDATMAHSIAEAVKNGDQLFHVNGSFHSNDKEGIVWYLSHYAPDIRVVTVSVSSDIAGIRNGVADFIVKVDEDMTKTY